MKPETANQYLRTKVMSASPAELRLMLIEGAIRFCHQGRDGLESKDYEKSFEGLTQAKAIIMELINGLRPEVDAELCNRLSGLYTFMYTRLIEANLEKEPSMVDEVIKLLEYECETWTLLIEQLAKERSGGTVPAPPTSDQAKPMSTLSVEG